MSDPQLQGGATATPQEQAVAQALIDRERADLRRGFTIVAVLFTISASCAGGISYLLFHRAAALGIAAVIIVLLVIVRLGIRLARLSRFSGGVRANWRAGRLNDGRPALDAARELLAEQQAPPPPTA